jgi:glycosyltransferase involved in cell wall biosynthesis
MKILFIGADTPNEHNSEEWRIDVPFRALRRAGIPVEYLRVEEWLSALEDEWTKAADLVIFQRNTFGYAINKILYWRTLGKPIVVDLDDAYGLMGLDTGSPNAEFWALGIQTEDGKRVQLEPKPYDLLKWGLKIAGALSSPSELILDDWKDFGIRRYLLPNYVDPSYYKRVEVYREPGKIYIGGGGSMGHIKSWRDSGISEALSKICREDKRLIVAFAGDERVYSRVNVPRSNKAPLGWVSPILYHRSLSLFDIGVVPLAGEYDRRRSWIKPVEYAIMGIPWIGTNYEPNLTAPGGKVIENGIMNWYNAIMETVERLPELQSKVFSARKAVLDHFSIDKNISNLLTTYQKIIDES